MLAEAELRKDLGDIGAFVRDITKEEFLGQGHNLTGKSVKSVEYNVDKEGKFWVIELMHLDHMTYLNTGIPADRIPFNLGSGAKKSEFINALIKYAKLRNIGKGFQERKSFAFATARTMKNGQGSPTKGSYRFSNNGRRKGWLDNPINNQESSIQDQLEEAWYNFVANNLQDKIDELILKYSNIKAL